MLTVGRHILAKYLVLTPRRINQLVDEGIIQKTGRGAYPLVDSIQSYLRYLKSQLPEGALEEEMPSDEEPLLTESQMEELIADLRERA